MFIEEKRYNKEPSRSQLNCLAQINRYCIASKLYRGSYVVIFEKTTPDDGKIRIGKVNSELFLKLKDISKDEFISFLRFESAF